jgi:predicted DNA repair protein MutK
VAYEKDKIKGAIRTDFILSAEIIAITLGTVADASLTQQVIVMSGIAIVMTVGVYGLVAGIVKLDDLGLWLTQKPGQFAKKIGSAILSAAPYMMKTLSVVGTAAMFLVGGGILTHGVPVLHHWIEVLARRRQCRVCGADVAQWCGGDYCRGGGVGGGFRRRQNLARDQRLNAKPL